MTWLVLKKKARGRQDYAVTGGGRARGVACRAPSAAALRFPGDWRLRDMPGMLRLLTSITFTQTEACLSVASDPHVPHALPPSPLPPSFLDLTSLRQDLGSLASANT